MLSGAAFALPAAEIAPTVLHQDVVQVRLVCDAFGRCVRRGPPVIRVLPGVVYGRPVYGGPRVVGPEVGVRGRVGIGGVSVGVGVVVERTSAEAIRGTPISGAGWRAIADSRRPRRQGRPRRPGPKAPSRRRRQRPGQADAGRPGRSRWPGWPGRRPTAADQGIRAISAAGARAETSSKLQVPAGAGPTRACRVGLFEQWDGCFVLRSEPEQISQRNVVVLLRRGLDRLGAQHGQGAQ